MRRDATCLECRDDDQTSVDVASTGQGRPTGCVATPACCLPCTSRHDSMPAASSPRCMPLAHATCVWPQGHHQGTAPHSLTQQPDSAASGMWRQPSEQLVLGAADMRVGVCSLLKPSQPDSCCPRARFPRCVKQDTTVTQSQRTPATAGAHSQRPEPNPAAAAACVVLHGAAAHWVEQPSGKAPVPGLQHAALVGNTSALPAFRSSASFFATGSVLAVGE